MSRPVITVTTDFGQADGYVAAMKGVLLGICPDARLVDVSHEIGPQAVQQGAYVLSTVTPYFPPGTVHLAVVDPGVGSARRPVAVATARAFYVAPDNGLLALALAADPARQAVHLALPDGPPGPGPISATFHGRDVFAPAAAHLACGARLEALGRPIPVAELAGLPGLEPQRLPGGAWLGRVLHVDRFGNLITTIRAPILAALGENEAGQRLAVRLGDVRIVGLRRTFSDVAPGEWLAYVGSSGRLEIAIRDGSAAQRLGARAGDPVSVEIDSLAQRS